jgi:O-succinylbenzoic acid--CoA ligase
MSHLLPHQHLAAFAAERPDAVAVRSADRALTYRELDDRVASAARTDFGRLPVAYPAPLRVESIVTMLGLERGGGIAAPMPPHRGEEERRRQRVLAEPAAAIPGWRDDAAGNGRPHTLLFTSGSTGPATPVLLTAGNVVAAVAASHERVGNDAADGWLLAMPLHHVGGAAVVWRSVSAGGTVVLHDRFDAGRVAAALRSGEASIASLVPTMLRRVLEADPGPYCSVKAVLLGGSAADPALVERALDAGLPVLGTYGLTEATSQVATVRPGEERRDLGTSGTPLPGVAVTVVRHDGERAALGEPGEIVVSGPTVAPGAIDPGLGGVRTGDLGFLDRRSRLVVLGRRDDVIVTGGENVSPAVVEAALLGLPGVTMAAVYGTPDPEWGEAVTAALVAEAGVTTDAVRRHAAAHLQAHEVPKLWLRRDALPLLPNGKIDRAALRADGAAR